MIRFFTARATGVRVLLIATLATSLSGCFSPEKTIHGRSAIDQQVTAAAIRAAVGRLDLHNLDKAGLYWLETKGSKDIDAEWVEVCLRRRLAREGFQIYERDGNNRLKIQATVDFAASDLESTLIGVPLYLPGTGSLGDVSLYKSSTQIGRAQLGLLVWDSTGRLIQSVPEAQASRFFSNETYFTFIGPFTRTDLEEFVHPAKVGRDDD